MLRVLQRLERSLSWRLLSPACNLPPGVRLVEHDDHAHWLSRLQAARAQVFALDEADLGADARSSDEAASHLLACDAAGRIAGAVRLFLVDRTREALNASLIANFGHIRFPDAETARSQIAALDDWLATSPPEPRFVYAGGFFTTPEWRASGLAAALGMAAIAWARLHGSRRSVSFASVEGSAAKFFALLGAEPLPQPDQLPLPPFNAPVYGLRLRIVHFDSARPHPAIEPGVRAVQARLASMTAWAIPARAGVGSPA